MRKTGGDITSVFRFIEHIDEHFSRGPIRVMSEHAGGAYGNLHEVVNFTYFVNFDILCHSGAPF
jgi:hypothetical protein